MKVHSWHQFHIWRLGLQSLPDTGMWPHRQRHVETFFVHYWMFESLAMMGKISFLFRSWEQVCLLRNVTRVTWLVSGYNYNFRGMNEPQRKEKSTEAEAICWYWITQREGLALEQCAVGTIASSTNRRVILQLITAKLCDHSLWRERRSVSLHVQRRGGLLAATPVTRICINLLICLIHSGLISRRKKEKQKEREKRKKAKGDLLRKFRHHQEPKSGHNLCFHKSPSVISPCVLHVSHFSMFPFNASHKSLPFGFSWSASGCRTVCSVS